MRACVPEKNFPGATPPHPERRGGRGRGEKGGKGGDKGKKEKGGRERRKEGKGKGIRVGREGIGPPQCLTQIDAPAAKRITFMHMHAQK